MLSLISPEVRAQLRKEKEFFVVFRFITRVADQIDDMIIKNRIRSMAMDHHATQADVKPEEVEVMHQNNEKEFNSLQENASKIEAQKLNMMEQYKKNQTVKIGKIDKNGVELQVGDLCKVPFGNSFAICRIVKTHLTYKGSGNPVFAWQVSGAGYEMTPNDFKTAEKVGDIHTTPHLEYKWCGKTKTYIP